MFTPKKALFVCTYKGGRSQVAEFYAKQFAADSLTAQAACFDPGQISPSFVELLASLDITIQTASPPSIFDRKIRDQKYDYVVCMCTSVSNEMCQLFRDNIEKIFPKDTSLLHWDLRDFGECMQNSDNPKKCIIDICERIKTYVVELADSNQITR